MGGNSAMLRAVCTAYEDIGRSLKVQDFPELFHFKLRGTLSIIFRQVAANTKRNRSATKLVLRRAPVEHFPRDRFKRMLEKA